MKNKYAPRDVEKYCELYVEHVEAMTTEDLTDKCDIAAELAHRDNIIQGIMDLAKKHIINKSYNYAQIAKKDLAQQILNEIKRIDNV